MKIRISSNGLSVNCVALEFDNTTKIMYLLDNKNNSVGSIDMLGKYLKYNCIDKDTKFYNLTNKCIEM